MCNLTIVDLEEPFVDFMGVRYKGGAVLYDSLEALCVGDRDELEGMVRVIEEAKKCPN